MRHLLSLIVVVLLMTTDFANAQTPLSRTNELRLVIVLWDGSCLVGRPEESTLRIRSEILGELKLPLDGIATVEFQEKNNLASIKTIDGGRLVGAMVTKKVQLATSFGNLSLGGDSIRRMEVSCLGASAGNKAGLIALWSGEENSTDSVGGHNAALVGSVSYGHGKRGQAFFLDGTSYLKVRNTSELDAGKDNGMTIKCWINPETTGVQMPLVEYERTLGSRNGSDVGISLYINLPPEDGRGPGCIMANLVDEFEDHFITSTGNLVKAGVWQQVVLTYDKSSGVAAIYLDGEVVASKNFGEFTPKTTPAYFLIGAKTAYGSAVHPSDAFSGGLDEIAIYNRALSAAEIRAMYDTENSASVAN